MLQFIKNPPARFRPTPLWNCGESSDSDQIKTRIADMAAKGIGGLVVESDAACNVKDIADKLNIAVYECASLSRITDLSSTCEIKAVSSEAHLTRAGKVASFGFDFNDRAELREIKRAFDTQAVLGVTSLVPLSVPPTATWWPKYKLFADYAARVCHILSQGAHQAQVGVLLASDEIPDFTRIICERLLREHIDFDFIDEESVRRAVPFDSRLTIAGEEFEAIILPDISSVKIETAEKLREFAEEGGALICMGGLPASDSDDNVRAVFRDIYKGEAPQDIEPAFHRVQSNVFMITGMPEQIAENLREYMSHTLKLDVSVRQGGRECADISYISRKTDNGEVFFFANSAKNAREVRLSIRRDGAPYMFNLETGTLTALPNCTQQGSRTVLLHRFEEYGSLMVVFMNAPALALAPPAYEICDEIELPSGWDYSIDKNIGIYKQMTNIPEFLRGQRVMLRVVDPINTVEFIINGALAGVRPWAPYLVDITPLVKPGTNSIEIRITNNSPDSKSELFDGAIIEIV